MAKLARLKRWLRIPVWYWLRVVQCAFLLVIIATALRITSFGKVKRMLQRLIPVHPARPNHTAIDSLLWALPRTTQLIFGGAGCLYQAMAGEVLFNRNGLPVTIRIGIRKLPDGTLLAHAWLINEDKIIIGGDQEFILKSFRQFPDLPNSA
jgi:hypothetical protein